RGLLREGASNTYTVKKQIKVLSRKYTKGHVNSNGWIVPFVLSDFDDYSALLY
ncbi:hypothetical protein LCGC14_1429100, partial [marine sediment metagenome]